MASRLHRSIVGGALAVLLIANSGQPDVANPAVVAWTRNHVVTMGDAQSDLNRREAAVVRQVIAGARVIGLGEPFHGHEEPLAYRNRLVRHLVEHEGLTAVALESGLAETKRVGDYMLGGPGNARDVVFKNLSWRFNDLTANVELVEWLRSWNLAHPSKQVRLYGIDVSGGDANVEFGRSRASLDYLTDYLERAAPMKSSALRTRLAGLVDRFSNSGYAAMSVPDRQQLHETLAATQQYLLDERAALLRAAAPGDYEWAKRLANDATDAERIFAVWPNDPANPMPGAMLVAEIRDKAMAANTVWALEREGKGGRILLFESNTHVGAAPMVGLGRENMAGTSAGQELRKALGGAYRVILTASSLGKGTEDASIGSVDRVLVASGRPRALLSIRAAPDWWNTPQTLAHGGARVNTVTPKQAFDGIVYVDVLRPAALLPKEPTP